jgi:hypothetical protein
MNEFHLRGALYSLGLGVIGFIVGLLGNVPLGATLLLMAVGLYLIILWS